MRRTPLVPLALMAAILATGRGRAEDAHYSVAPLGCASLALSVTAPGWDWLEGDQGAGFFELTTVPAGGQIQLHLPVPPPGGSLALRAARPDSLGLPDYGDEWLWSRPLPQVEARLEGHRLVGRVRQGSGSECPLPDLILRLERAGQVTDLLRVPARDSFQFELGEREFSALSLAWNGQATALRLTAPGAQAETGTQPTPLEPDAVPAAPEWTGFVGDALELSSAVPLVLLQGEARLSPGAQAGRWLLESQGSDEILVVAEDPKGLRSLPFRWEGAAAPVVLDLTRSGPGSLRANPRANPRDADVLELVWLDGQGRQGRQTLPSGGLTLEGLSGVCRLQALSATGPVWKQTLDLAWSAPTDLRLSSQSDTLMRVELQDERGWSDVWELEWRAQGRSARRPAAAFHELPLPNAERLHLRWRAGRAPAQSRWSPWRELSLLPTPPGGLLPRPTAEGVRLSWEAVAWLRGRTEVERVLGSDTLRVLLPASAEAWLDTLAGDQLARYRVRNQLSHSQSPWSEPVWGARPRVSGNGVPSPARTLLTLAEWRGYSRVTHQALPAPSQLVEGRAGQLRDDQPLLGISPREAMTYCNWLNGELNLDGRYDSEGHWSAGVNGGCRLPLDASEAGGPGRVWTLGPDGARAAGSSDLRSGSGRRLYSLDARQPDIGLRLIYSPPTR